MMIQDHSKPTGRRTPAAASGTGARRMMKWIPHLAALVALLGSSATAAAQTVSGEAFGALVKTPLASEGKSPLAVLPAVAPGDGEMADASAGALSVPGVLSSAFLESMTSGASGDRGRSVQSVASLADVSVLDGLIRADRVLAVATSSHRDGSTTGNGNGSAFEGLVVNGVAVVRDGNVAPDTRINLPGVGYVVLNEQIRDGSGITVNMIHVVLQNALTGARTGEIIIGSATSAVN